MSRCPVDQAELDNDLPERFSVSAEDRADYYQDLRDDEFMEALELNLKKPDYAGDIYRALKP